MRLCVLLVIDCVMSYGVCVFACCSLRTCLCVLLVVSCVMLYGLLLCLCSCVVVCVHVLVIGLSVCVFYCATLHLFLFLFALV